MTSDTGRKSHVDQYASRHKESKDKGGGFVNRYAHNPLAADSNTHSSESAADSRKISFTKKYSSKTSDNDIESTGSLNNNSENSSIDAEKKKFSNLNSVRRKTNKKSFADAAKKSRLDCVFLVRGKDGQRDAWHYVLVDKSKKEVFLGASKSGSIDVSKYGEILYSGWGKDPPQEIVKKIEEEFGI